MGSKIKKLKTAEKQVKDIITKMNDYARDIYALKDAINEMMKGDGESAYWEGNNAIGWYKDVINKTNKLMGNYENSVEAISSFAKKVEKAENKSNIPPKTPKAAVKMILNNITGSKYTNSLKLKSLDRMSANIPTTVGSDTASDDKNIASYKCFIKMKKALDEISNDLSSMNKTWESIGSNTTGDFHTTAGNRAKYLLDRKSEIASVKSDLDETYIGDLLFS